METFHSSQAALASADWETEESLAGRLRAVLTERQMSQSELARRAGLSASYVSMLINGQRGPRISHAATLSLRKALRVPASFFAVSMDGNSVVRR